MKNKLALESSPYLLQHADNPVHWYPWGDEALNLARELNRPILLSIGYAACHWCHVMAHESFEDPEIAAIMNRYFVNVKVDREERPDLDRIYMNAVVAMTGQGGWPMTVALTPDGKPFYGGTYFPPAPRHGLPAFGQLLLSLAESWENNREKILESADGISNHLQGTMVMATSGDQLDKSLLADAFAAMRRNFDSRHGGFGSAPKFPQPMTLEFLLRHSIQNENGAALDMVELTLEKMALGGIYDHIGGGFARYSTDARWLVPHFEKMLYDNALLARLYLHAWRVTGRPLFRKTVIETLDWLSSEMRHPRGGFFSSLDADSEGEEGKYYVWTAAEIDQALGADADLFKNHFSITEQGNWEGTNILALSADPFRDQVSSEERQALTKARSKLAEVRAGRVRPGLDDKVLTSWNGLVIAAFAEAGRDLKIRRYGDVAVEAAEFLFDQVRSPDGRLFHTWKEGHGSKIGGFLEDYAFLAEGLIALYQYTFDDRWFTWSRELVHEISEHFRDDAGVGFFDTADDHEELISRPRELQDNAVPSGNAMAAAVLLQQYLYTGEGSYWDEAMAAMASMQEMMRRYPLGFAQWLTAASLALAKPLEIAIVGEPAAADTQTLVDVVFDRYRPNAVAAVGAADSAVPLLHNRSRVDGRATAYVCRHFVCEAPVVAADGLREQLAGSKR